MPITTDQDEYSTPRVDLLPPEILSAMRVSKEKHGKKTVDAPPRDPTDNPDVTDLDRVRLEVVLKKIGKSLSDLPDGFFTHPLRERYDRLRQLKLDWMTPEEKQHLADQRVLELVAKDLPTNFDSLFGDDRLRALGAARKRKERREKRAAALAPPRPPGRPPINGKAMTAAERKDRSRQGEKQAEALVRVAENPIWGIF